ncbi:MAG TPA: hypothetical protein VEK10_06150 [Steroidobacteraceae bacterium]|nr:hypothetical protein [Steroidobacteraceae bacterium]
MIGELLPRAALAAADIAEMYRLFTTHFERVSEYRFRVDLERKDWVIRVRDAKTLLGFTSLQFLRTRAAAGDLNVLYSGDTIMKPEARSTTLLARTWIDSVRRISELHAAAEMHWLLLVSGFRTYRLLPVFWREFFPSCTQPTPAEVRGTVTELAGALFAAGYDERAGIVRFADPQPLRPELSRIPESRLADPHVRFFASANPGHADGDELVCWTRLAHDNLTAAGARMWHGSERVALARTV